jgi:hypothetical protein
MEYDNPSSVKKVYINLFQWHWQEDWLVSVTKQQIDQEMDHENSRQFRTENAVSYMDV